MSQKVLIGPLIDFGNSFWNSALAGEEFPGLKGRQVKTAGKFGIGFFSVFLLGDNVKVVSKRYDAARSETKVLEFPHLARRPLLRRAEPGEALGDFSTRVVVELSDDELLEPGSFRSDRRPFGGGYHPSISGRLLRMIVALDVRVRMFVEDELVWDHDPDWSNVPSEVFLRELFAESDPADLAGLVKDFADRLMLIGDGEIVGRAALDFGRATDGYAVSVDGFASPSFRGDRFGSSWGDWNQPSLRGSYYRGVVGVVLGRTDDASRKTAVAEVSDDVIGRWATEQVKLIPKQRFKPDQLVSLAHLVLDLGGDPLDLPCAYIGGDFVEMKFIRDWLNRSEEVIVPLRSLGTALRPAYISALSYDFFIMKPIDALIVPHPDEISGDLFDKKRSREIVEEGKGLTAGETDAIINRTLPGWLFESLRTIWGENFDVDVSRYQMFKSDLFNPPPTKWGVKLCRRSR